MFLQREKNKRQAQPAYQIDNKNQGRNQQPLKRQLQDRNTPSSEFSLLANIEQEESQRKSKMQQYYSTLKKQYDEVENKKKKAKQEKLIRDREEEEKIKKENQILQRRYEEEKKRQNMKKPDFYNQPQTVVQVSKGVTRHKQVEIKEIQEQDNDIARYQPLNYPSSMQNQNYSFAPRRNLRDAYYNELLGQKRQLDEEATYMADFNRILQKETHQRKTDSYGLEQLKKLNVMLENKNQDYMSIDFSPKKDLKRKSYTEQSYQITQLKQKMNHSSIRKDQWKNLD